MTEMSVEQKILALTVLQKKVKAAVDEYRASWGEGKNLKDRGSASFAGELLGTVTMESSGGQWKLEDKDALLRWALENNPSLVRFDPHIPESTIAQLKKNPVTEDGEVLPGFELGEPGRKIVVRTERGVDANALISRAVANGELTVSELLELEQ